MANEKHDPWALLAAARGSVLQHKERLLDCDHDAETCTCDLAAQKIVLLDRIDAALAEHADSDTPVVEWCAVGDTWATAYPVDGVEMTVMRWADGPWKWWTKLETSAQGTASTEEEAKSAAIAAARGLR